VTAKGNRLFLAVFDWPASGKLHLPGLKTPIVSARLLKGNQSETISHDASAGWTILQLPPRAPEKLVSVVELQCEGSPEVDPTWGIDPNIGTEILAEFATVDGAKQAEKRWMEKFGEWKSVVRVHDWQPEGKATWEVEILKPGDYCVHLTYAGEARLVWCVEIEGGERIQNQQNSSHNYQEFPIGWMNFPKPGRYQVSVSCLEGDTVTASLKAIRFIPVR
jgi:alpha-L-fucosidase